MQSSKNKFSCQAAFKVIEFTINSIKFINSTVKQLFLNFPIKSEYLPEDFFVSNANSEAFAYIHAWPNWNSGIYSKILLIYGEEGSGKTHLCHLWQKLSNAKFINIEDELYSFKSPSIIENIDNLNQEMLFHLINYAYQNQIFLLLTSKASPLKLNFSLADLKSRILAIPSIAINAPDEELLKIVLCKNLSERNLKTHPATIDYIINRIERSFSKLFQFIEEVDYLSKSNKRAITIPMVKEIIKY